MWVKKAEMRLYDLVHSYDLVHLVDLVHLEITSGFSDRFSLPQFFLTFIHTPQLTQFLIQF